MAKLVIFTGTTPNDGTGDSLFAGAGKINSNFTEIYTCIGNGTTLGIASFTQLNVSGIVTAGSLSIGATQVISAARQLQNIASLDATTTATIESAIANAPNTFTDINVSGLSTFAGITTVTGVSLFTRQLSVAGVLTATSLIGQVNSGIATITTLSGTNATYTTGNFTTGNIVTGIVTNISGTNLNYTGVATVGSLNIGATQVISSARQLQNIASLDATTTATIESAIANAPNTFTDINVSGLSTFAGITTVTGVSLFTRQLSVSGVSTFAGIATYTASLFGTQASFSGIVTANSFRPSSGYIQAPDGTNSFFIYNTNGNVAFQGTIGASQLNSATGFRVIGLAGTDATFENNVSVSGVSTFAGITTVTGVSLFTRQLSVSGVSTLGTLRIASGIVTATSGIITYYGDGSKLTGISAGGIGTQWVTNSSGIHTFANVGLGTNDPLTALYLDGVIGFRNSNIRIGSNQTLSGATGSSNIAIGDFAGISVNAGTRNVLIGDYSNAFGLDGSYNVMVGYRGSSQGSHNIHIGEYITGGTGNNNIVIGNGDFTNTYNFGAPDPSKDLQFAVGVNTTGNDPSNSKYWLVGNERFNVGFGTINPTEKVSILGRTQILQDSSSNNRLIFRAKPGNSYRWSIDNDSGNLFRIFREDDATAANGAVGLQIDPAGNTTISGITTIGLGSTSTPVANSQMSFELTSNTNLRIKVRGTDGVLRSANITLA